MMVRTPFMTPAWENTCILARFSRVTSRLLFTGVLLHGPSASAKGRYWPVLWLHKLYNLLRIPNRADTPSLHWVVDASYCVFSSNRR